MGGMRALASIGRGQEREKECRRGDRAKWRKARKGPRRVIKESGENAVEERVERIREKVERKERNGKGLGPVVATQQSSEAGNSNFRLLLGPHVSPRAGYQKVLE